MDSLRNDEGPAAVASSSESGASASGVLNNRKISGGFPRLAIRIPPSLYFGTLQESTHSGRISIVKFFITKQPISAIDYDRLIIKVERLSRI